ncbi:hypothetical protein F4861DRAFT_527781 [Xylaria intraflava]|nr:hypothetical protein F4861DRAFT_527781 [Xylaria intraflava]
MYTPIRLTVMNPELLAASIESDGYYYKSVADHVSIRLSAGLDVLLKIAKRIEPGGKPRLGFIYIDARRL